MKIFLSHNVFNLTKSPVISSPKHPQTVKLSSWYNAIFAHSFRSSIENTLRLIPKTQILTYQSLGHLSKLRKSNP